MPIDLDKYFNEAEEIKDLTDRIMAVDAILDELNNTKTKDVSWVQIILNDNTKIGVNGLSNTQYRGIRDLIISFHEEKIVDLKADLQKALDKTEKNNP